jgi:hypothetical protein
MPAVRENTVVVKGYTELIRAFNKAQVDTNIGMKRTLKEVGEIVRVDAAARFSHYDGRSAAGYRTVVTQRGVDVRQSIKGKGIRPQYGAIQMTKALLPALDAKAGEVNGAFESFLDRVVAKNFG